MFVEDLGDSARRCRDDIDRKNWLKERMKLIGDKQFLNKKSELLEYLGYLGEEQRDIIEKRKVNGLGSRLNQCVVQDMIEGLNQLAVQYKYQKQRQINMIYMFKKMVCNYHKEQYICQLLNQMHCLKRMIRVQAIQNINRLVNGYFKYCKSDIVYDLVQFGSEFYGWKQLINSAVNRIKKMSADVFEVSKAQDIDDIQQIAILFRKKQQNNKMKKLCVQVYQENKEEFVGDLKEMM